MVKKNGYYEINDDKLRKNKERRKDIEDQNNRHVEKTKILKWQKISKRREAKLIVYLQLNKERRDKKYLKFLNKEMITKEIVMGIETIIIFFNLNIEKKNWFKQTISIQKIFLEGIFIIY